MAGTEEKRIIKVRYEHGGKWDPVKIYVIFEEETEEKYLRDFFDDEIYPNPDRMVGMTEEQAREYIRNLDVAYLRS